MTQSPRRRERAGPAPALRRVMGPKLLLLFIIGDILGTGIYALTGDVAAEVGGVAWLPFLVAFAVATVTAMSYLELVTKYPQAAGAALYTQKAFGLQSLTFLVAFVVMASGITRQPPRPGRSPPTWQPVSASTSASGVSCCWQWGSLRRSRS